MKTPRLPKVPDGRKRAFVRCKKCKCVYWYDYQPFGLSGGMACLPCGHDLSGSFSSAVEWIDGKQFNSGKKFAA